LADFQSLARKNGGYKYLLLAVDLLSRRLFGEPVKSKQAEEIKRAFRKIFKRMPALPQQIFTDQGFIVIKKNEIPIEFRQGV
jgi:hypothetical protein